MDKLKANILNELAAKENKTIAELERVLGLGNGAIGKAIARNSKLSTDTIDKIRTVYPAFAQSKGIPPLKTNEETGTIIAIQSKLIAALERSEQHAIEAKDAYKKNAEILANSIPALQERIEEIGDTVTGLGALVSGRLAPAVGLTELQASAVIEDKTLQARKHRKDGTPPDSGTKRKQVAKTHQQV